jgi:hypothetical protein
MEDLEWSPPILTFIIVRHGATALGSSRAEKQLWILDIDAMTAEPHRSGYRQIYPKASPWDAKPVAEKLAKLILGKKR